MKDNNTNQVNLTKHQSPLFRDLVNGNSTVSFQWFLRFRLQASAQAKGGRTKTLDITMTGLS